ncbi:Zn-dependent protease with chaperone function [Cytobacillus firmus]|uniref:Zn-dependent protease with chaperone function n=2 Tax=Cytobacillus TaxID=2675230 RepID=A0A366JGS6_CYTFI|nr:MULTISPECIES: M56 family metallopeptidase [Cytobacillus]RBP86189.1 Zn-dependent protease with chaperone function [Cytobacillus firmus]TDX36398.1 Zn-dependent protease with chaperone function [Cytobacillus oceanisediminis]
MSRLFQTLNMYVLWLVGVITSFIGFGIVLHFQAVSSYMYWMLECCNLQYNHIRVLTLITLGILFVSFALHFLFLSKKTKKFITKLNFYRTNCYESNVIEIFQQKYSVSIQVIDINQPLAFTYGFIYPKILVSTSLINLLQPDELEAVLEHEHFHCQKRDPFKLSILFSLARVFSFLPISRMLYERYMMEKEIKADTFAIHKVGIKAVASALYKLMINVPSSSFATVHFQNQSIQETNTRIEVLLTGKYKRPPISLLEWMRSIIHIFFIVYFIGCVSLL